MKKLLMFAAISAVTLVACKKDDDDDNNNPTNEQMILGTWTSVVIEGSTYDNTNSDTVASYSIPGPFYTLTFEANGVVKSQFVGDSTYTGTYTLNGNTLVAITDGDTVGGEISTLTSNKLIFEETDTYTEGSVSYTDKSYFEFSK
ncbi:MAG TPA: hypothetical protein DCG19_14095 [Cryomorphaceae bacterium]|nr:hypothetical protein [Owenweeksia sp.]MBG00191.1 hypothetical protein [Owenweeksia sp.]HAD98537.1 hypothetical protein [Cryomorphaceae bacterium]HBF21113.1 hypothetical protein [Cryomorphaceae bacterium]|tara:strand:- start:31 stop:465 length:435 start_codon:yes stop_codon:yes gene_type:complete